MIFSWKLYYHGKQQYLFSHIREKAADKDRDRAIIPKLIDQVNYNTESNSESNNESDDEGKEE